jgi:dihydroorotase
MSRVLTYATGLGLPVIAHAEDASLTDGTVATESEFATRLGLPASPAYAEALMVARDIRLAEAAGARLHIAQATTAESLDLIRQAKQRGVAVTCGITPNHLLLNEISIGAWRSFARLSPPLRSEADRLAVVAAVRDGTIDIIASGHDPLTAEDKRLPYAQATPGAVGLETLLPLALTLVHNGAMTLLDLLALLTANPASLFGLPTGSLLPGTPADLVLLDPDAPWRISDASLTSQAKNTPFDGQPTAGRVVMTWRAGRPVFAAT